MSSENMEKKILIFFTLLITISRRFRTMVVISRIVEYTFEIIRMTARRLG